MRKTIAAASLAALAVAACLLRPSAPSEAAAVPETPGLTQPEPAPLAAKVYGEWRIRVRPDKGAEYAQLIRDKGLPLFREAGGRMVGWWTTLIGDLYEHVTIWEYDGMAAFEKAVELLGKDERFKSFAARRDPLLSGEESRFLRLASAHAAPALAETAKVAVHEVHRVRLERRDAYWNSVALKLPAIKKHGFRCAGPFETAVGSWSEVTYLWFFESLAEREAKMAAMEAEGGGRIDAQTFETADEVTTRVLVPAAFAY